MSGFPLAVRQTCYLSTDVKNFEVNCERLATNSMDSVGDESGSLRTSSGAIAPDLFCLFGVSSFFPPGAV